MNDKLAPNDITGDSSMRSACVALRLPFSVWCMAMSHCVKHLYEPIKTDRLNGYEQQLFNINIYLIEPTACNSANHKTTVKKLAMRASTLFLRGTALYSNRAHHPTAYGMLLKPLLVFHCLE